MHVVVGYKLYTIALFLYIPNWNFLIKMCDDFLCSFVGNTPIATASIIQKGKLLILFIKLYQILIAAMKSYCIKKITEKHNFCWRSIKLKKSIHCI